MVELPPHPDTAVHAVRTRPGMYFGDMDEPPHVLLRDVLANAMDLYLAGSARTIEVTLHADDAVSIQDDGPGMEPDTAVRALTAPILTATLDGHRPHVHLGGANLGLFTVSAACERLTVTTHRLGWEHRFTVARGRLSAPDRREAPDGRGTTVWFRPDPEIFRCRVFDRRWVTGWLELISDASPGLRMVLRDEGWEPARERTGLRSRIRGYEPIIELAASHAYTTVRAAIGWSGNGDPRIESFAGYVDTVDGGTHVTGLLRGLDDVARRVKLPRGLRAGLRACLVVFTPDIHWGQPTMTQVTNPELAGVVRTIVREAVSAKLAADPALLEALRHRAR
jgi:DNA gyrase subunit B